MCIDVSLRKNVSFIIIIIRGINNAKDACTNYKILVKRNLSSCIYKSPNEINFHESSKIDKYSSSSCQYIYMRLNQESFVNSDSFSHRFEYRGIVGTR